MTEYLLKSDVMAAMQQQGYACGVHILNKLPTFPATSLAVDGKLRERYQLLIRMHESFLNLKLGAYKSISDTINTSHRWTDEALIRHGLEIIKLLDDVMSSLPPAPSVATPTPNRTDIDWQTKITAAPLKLEAGKLYRTRDGRKAFVSIVKSDCNCVHGMVEEYYESITWCLDGRHYSDGKTVHIDLISLWDEPTPESGTSKLDELFENSRIIETSNHGIAKYLQDVVVPILRLLAERGDK